MVCSNFHRLPHRRASSTAPLVSIASENVNHQNVYNPDSFLPCAFTSLSLHCKDTNFKRAFFFFVTTEDSSWVQIIQTRTPRAYTTELSPSFPTNTVKSHFLQISFTGKHRLKGLRNIGTVSTHLRDGVTHKRKKFVSHACKRFLYGMTSKGLVGEKPMLNAKRRSVRRMANTPTYCKLLLESS